MRVSFLFFPAALMCGLVAVCAAGEQPRQTSSSRLDGVAGIVLPDDLGQALRDGDRRRFDPEQDEIVTCYTVQSYRVKRQSRGSDVVEPVGYSTCLRASKFGVKKAVESDKAPLR